MNSLSASAETPLPVLIGNVPVSLICTLCKSVCDLSLCVSQPTFVSQLLRSPVTTPCNHTFCKECIERFIDTGAAIRLAQVRREGFGLRTTDIDRYCERVKPVCTIFDAPVRDVSLFWKAVAC
jgi:hypothetical protein